MEEPQKTNTLIYVIAHASRDAATANWKEFTADPEWQTVQKASEVNGKIVEKVDSTFMTLTDFSLIPDRKSTRLNSSHTVISYAVFCLKKKKKESRRNES